MTSRFLRRLAASVLAGACFSASASPVTYAPGSDSGWLNVTVNPADIASAEVFYLFATMTNVNAGDKMIGAVSKGLNGTGDVIQWAATWNSDITDAVLSTADIADLLDGSFSVKFGTDATSASAVTFDNVQVKFFNASTGWLSTVVSVQPAVDPPANVPEPASLALVGVALAGLAASRRRRS